jgi:hypothetical protein
MEEMKQMNKGTICIYSNVFLKPWVVEEFAVILAIIKQVSTQVLWRIYQHFCELSNFEFNLHGMRAALCH